MGTYQTQVEMGWMECSVSQYYGGRSHLRLFGIHFDFQARGDCLECPQLEIWWSKKRWKSHEICFVWQFGFYPLFGVSFRRGFDKREFAVYPQEWVPDWAWRLFGYNEEGWKEED